MTWHGYLSKGGIEILNNERARAMALSAAVPANWYVDPPNQNVQPALAVLGGVQDSAPYGQVNLALAPWYDESQIENSANFFGVYGLGISGLPDSTRQVQLIESVFDGGAFGSPRKAIRQAKVTAMLLARGREALEYGLAWLDAVLDATACGQHSEGCGVSDLQFLTDVPPAQDSGQSSSDYASLVTSKLRFLHTVATIAGPIVDQEIDSGTGINAYIVDFTIGAGRPGIYTALNDLMLPPTIPTVVEDVPYNLAPYPSMELTDGTTPVIATNYATNPSVETNTTGWNASFYTSSGSSPSSFFTYGQSNDLAANRTYSMRARILGDGTTAASGECHTYLSQAVSLAAVAQGARMSIGMWVGLYVMAGASGSSLKNMTVTAQFTNASGNVGSAIVLGSSNLAADFNGKAMAKSGIVIPAGATGVTVTADFDVNWTSSTTAADNSDIRCYADALIVSVP